MSWNMYCYNKRHDDVVRFVRESRADVFFLQEVPHPLLPRLTALYPFSAHAVDSERVYGGAGWTNYNVILSRYPLTDTRAIPFDPLPLRLRTKLMILLLWPLGWARTWNRNAVAATADTPLGPVTLVSAHLTLSSPTLRAREFKKIVSDIDEHAILGGDLNVIEYPPLKILSWLLGSPIRESTPWYDERALFEKRFESAGLQNPLRGRVTHPFSRSQLDHILVTIGLKVTGAGVSEDHAGSDHAPVFLELAPHISFDKH